MTEPMLSDISDDMRHHLNELRKSTGIGPYALLKGQREDMPEGLSGPLIAMWLRGERRTARQDHLDFVLSLWDRRAGTASRRVELTKAHLDEFVRQRERTGVDAKSFFKPPYTPPEGLRIHHVHNWTQGATRSAPLDHLDYVLGAWRALPDVCAPDAGRLGVEGYRIEGGRIILDDAISARLRELRSRTGRSATALLAAAKEMGRSIPPGLKVPEIARWLSGQAKSADPACLLFVIEVYEALCEYEPMAAAGAGFDASRVPITEEVRRTLERERGRTGVMQGELLRGAADVPGGLSAPLISQWINGTIGSARQDFLDYVIERWTGLPDR